MITYEGESLYPKEYQSENINTETINNSNIINTNTTGNNVVLKKVQSKKKVYTANKLTPSIIGFFKVTYLLLGYLFIYIFIIIIFIYIINIILYKFNKFFSNVYLFININNLFI
eukprot:GHVR01134242.1.p1 GENE.GHVR01134242.1~~GHVR01134242.1.p1  ORF type:complete len:114 (+),score=25.77 GHVR01134242.1:108-449(+)